ncbi:MAG: hypothetical protein EBZ75_15450 [Oxalobacteraceae bacterium]|nr:hypothetical protein [Oxalobacteraceae bacterium]
MGATNDALTTSTTAKVTYLIDATGDLVAQGATTNLDVITYKSGDVIDFSGFTSSLRQVSALPSTVTSADAGSMLATRGVHSAGSWADSANGTDLKLSIVDSAGVVKDLVLKGVTAASQVTFSRMAPSLTEFNSAKTANGSINATENASSTTFQVGLSSSGAQQGDVLELLLNGASFPVPKSLTLSGSDVANGFINLTLSGSDFGANGSKSLTAKISDSSGTTSKTSSPIAFTLDTLALSQQPVLG